MTTRVAKKQTAKDEVFAGISSDAVAAKTGKTWPEWFKILDADGAAEMSHKEIANHLGEKRGVGPWWRQMVTVGYEQAKGRREKHQTALGYSISRSATLAVPVAIAFNAWNDARLRNRWLKEKGLTIRKATEPKGLRITWPDGTNVEVNIYAKGKAKCQVSVQQNKLPDAQAGTRMKEYWGEALERLKAILTPKT